MYVSGSYMGTLQYRAFHATGHWALDWDVHVPWVSQQIPDTEVGEFVTYGLDVPMTLEFEVRAMDGRCVIGNPSLSFILKLRDPAMPGLN